MNTAEGKFTLRICDYFNRFM